MSALWGSGRWGAVSGAEITPKGGCRSRDHPGAGQVPSGLISQQEGGRRHPAASIPLLSREVLLQQPSSSEKLQCQAARCWVNILAAAFVSPSPSRTDASMCWVNRTFRWCRGGCPGMEAAGSRLGPLTMPSARLPACTSRSWRTDLCPVGDGGISLANTLRPSCGAPAAVMPLSPPSSQCPLLPGLAQRRLGYVAL